MLSSTVTRMARPKSPWKGRDGYANAYIPMPASAQDLLARSKRIGLDDDCLRPVNEGEISGETQWTTERKVQRRA